MEDRLFLFPLDLLFELGNRMQIINLPTHAHFEQGDRC